MDQFLSSACSIYNENEWLCLSSLRITKYELAFDSDFAGAQILLSKALKDTVMFWVRMSRRKARID